MVYGFLRLTVVVCLLSSGQGVRFPQLPKAPSRYVNLPKQMDVKRADVSSDRVQWKALETSYGVEFTWKDYNRNHIKRALRSTQGEPWPLPQVFKQQANVFILNPTRFKMAITHNFTSDVITNAIYRYNKTIFEYSIPITEENFKNAPKSRVSEEMYYKRNADSFLDAEEICVMTIHVTGCCDVNTSSMMCNDTCVVYPSLQSNESYTLTVNSSGILLTSPEVWGVVRGLETFSQLVTKYREKFYVRKTTISDFPRFPHRGVLIDTSRHFVQMDVLFDVLEGMAQNKMNVLHWHMTDDQSFPYKSQAFPNLSEKGAYHPNMVYTRHNISDVIEYARLRGIRVIPEFDVPGHTFSWGLAFPELLTQCYVDDKPVPGFLGPINPTNKRVFKFLEKLFQEVLEVFPDKSLHLGGDEVLSKCWASNPEVFQLFKKEYKKQSLGIQYSTLRHGHSMTTNSSDSGQSKTFLDKVKAIEKNIRQLSQRNVEGGMRTLLTRYIWQYFNRRLKRKIDKIARVRVGGLDVIMWEDGLSQGVQIPKDVIIQVWKSTDADFRNILKQGYRTIYSNCWYLDNYRRGLHWPEFYSCDPGERGNHTGGLILGGEACIWSEFISSEMVMFMLWPRASAVAEKLWSSGVKRSMDDVARRLGEQRCRMLRRGLDVGYANGPEVCVRKYADNSDQSTDVKPRNANNTTFVTQMLRTSDNNTDQSSVVKPRKANNKTFATQMIRTSDNKTGKHSFWKPRKANNKTFATQMIRTLHNKTDPSTDVKPRKANNKTFATQKIRTLDNKTDQSTDVKPRNANNNTFVTQMIRTSDNKTDKSSDVIPRKANNKTFATQIIRISDKKSDQPSYFKPRKTNNVAFVPQMIRMSDNKTENTSVAKPRKANNMTFATQMIRTSDNKTETTSVVKPRKANTITFATQMIRMSDNKADQSSVVKSRHVNDMVSTSQMTSTVSDKENHDLDVKPRTDNDLTSAIPTTTIDQKTDHTDVNPTKDTTLSVNTQMNNLPQSYMFTEHVDGEEIIDTASLNMTSLALKLTGILLILYLISRTRRRRAL